MLLNELIDALVDLFYRILYSMFSSICVLIDFIKSVFYKLCGLDSVNINGEDSDLLTSLIKSDVISKVFLTVFLIGVILLVVFTIIAIIKSNLNEKQNWKTVLSKTAQSFVITLLIPFTVFAGIVLVNTVMKSVNLAMNTYSITGSSTIGGQFLTCIGANSYIGPSGKQNEIASMFVSGELSYSNLSVVKRYYDIQSMNYIIGLLGGLVMLVMFCLSALTFVQRLFDVILLYIVSPISISTLPLDEGNRYKVWKDMLISKILSAYGIILVMNLFFLIIPQVYQIDFFGNSWENGIVYVLFLIGGSFAVTKASRVIAQLCGGQQTGGELAQMIYNIRSGLALSHAVTGVIGGTVGGLIGGSDYKKGRQKKQGRIESMSNSAKSNRNQKPITDASKKSKAKQIGAAPIRLASMPIGMLHDLTTGGLIRVGKKFMPRLKNAFTGSTVLNRAEVKPKSRKDSSRTSSEAKPTENTSNTKPNDTTTNKDEKNVEVSESERDNKPIIKEMEDANSLTETKDSEVKTREPIINNDLSDTQPTNSERGETDESK